MAKNLKTLALGRLAGFRHTTVKVPEWGDVTVVLREPSAEAWMRWNATARPEQEDELSVAAQARRHLEGDVELFTDVLCDTSMRPVFTRDDRDALLAVYGPVHSRLLRRALSLIADGENAKKT